MISLEHVTRKYGAKVALADVSFHVKKGEILGLLGPNGAGKTTALNIMTGYLPPDGGTVRVDQLDMLTQGRACRRRIGYLPERPPLYDEMTVGDYLSFVCALREVTRRDRKRHVEEILALCGLTEVADRICGHLSKGFRQRVGIAQALCGSPEVLILDEPTVGLDPKQVVEMRELIRRLGREHTIVFSTHILSEAQQLCSSVVILREGRAVRAVDLGAGAGELLQLRLTVCGEEGTLLAALRSLRCVREAEALSFREGELTARLSCLREDERGRAEDQIFHLLSALDAPIRSMTREREDLESLFLQAVGE